MAVKPSSRLISQGLCCIWLMGFFPWLLWFSHSSPGMFGIGSLLPFPRSDPSFFSFFLFSYESIHIPKFSTLSLSLSLSHSSPHLLTLLFHFSFTSHTIHYITPITRHCHANNLPCTEQVVKSKPKQEKTFSFLFHLFWPFVCCLSVVLLLNKGNFPENVQTVSVLQ